MLDICLLGTGGTQPLVNRWLTSLMVRYQGHAVLIDCGEGTQIAAQKVGLSLKPVDKILITHLHADHISGLPGLLLTMGNMGRTEPLSIIGPVGTERAVHSLLCIARTLPFEVQVSELDGEDELMYFLDCDIRAFAVQHGMPCYGYSFSLPRAGKFDAARAREQGIPLQLWKRLQKGETVEEAGTIYTPDMVLGLPAAVSSSPIAQIHAPPRPSQKPRPAPTSLSARGCTVKTKTCPKLKRTNTCFSPRPRNWPQMPAA